MQWIEKIPTDYAVSNNYFSVSFGLQVLVVALLQSSKYIERRLPSREVFLSMTPQKNLFLGSTYIVYTYYKKLRSTLSSSLLGL